MTVFPETMPAITGERCVVFVQIEEEMPGSASMPVTISATSSDAAVFVENSQFELGPIAEVTIIPNQPNAAQAEFDAYWISATITGKRAAYIQTS